jgi:molecular chaperone GrpE
MRRFVSNLFKRPEKPAPEAARDAGALARERALLIEACIEVADQSGSEMLRERVEEALAGAGVHAVRVDGEPFDEERHRAVGRVPTEEPDRHGIVAVTQVQGYADGQRIIRKPEVLVYRHQR